MFFFANGVFVSFGFSLLITADVDRTADVVVGASRSRVCSKNKNSMSAAIVRKVLCGFLLGFLTVVEREGAWEGVWEARDSRGALGSGLCPGSVVVWCTSS